MPASHSESAEFVNAFEIKSGAVNLPVLKLLSVDMEYVSSQLWQKIRQAPEFFRNAPMAIDIHSLVDADVDIDFVGLVRAMRDCGLIPVGLCGGAERQNQAAQAAAGLSVISLARHELPPPASAPKPKAAPPPAEVHTKIVEQPVRSGQRIYVAGGDLVVMSQVSAGAEIMADGNIHVYGTLRGRALAGVQGNLGCRIFCHDLQAELVSIGGHYKISENIDDSLRGVPVQIYLQDQSLIIQRI
ncbi:MAG: septum site-determining protein MinC [Candidatus Methylumidiphilus sp.]